MGLHDPLSTCTMWTHIHIPIHIHTQSTRAHARTHMHRTHLTRACEIHRVHTLAIYTCPRTCTKMGQLSKRTRVGVDRWDFSTTHIIQFCLVFAEFDGIFFSNVLTKFSPSKFFLLFFSYFNRPRWQTSDDIHCRNTQWIFTDSFVWMLVLFCLSTLNGNRT